MSHSTEQTTEHVDLLTVLCDFAIAGIPADIELLSVATDLAEARVQVLLGQLEAGGWAYAAEARLTLRGFCLARSLRASSDAQPAITSRAA